MRLYAKVHSDRASKSQGGNNFITIDLFVGSAQDSRKIAEIGLEISEENVYRIKYTEVFQDKGKDIYLSSDILQEGELKGEKQKGERPEF